MNPCPECGNELSSAGQCSICLLRLGKSQRDSSALPAAAASLPSISDLNDLFPQLEVARLIGRGGMGAIYQARQTNLDRDVALKIIATEVAEDPAFIERFEREAKTLARLSHPNIVTVYDFGQTSDGQAYLIMEYVDGINLREAIDARTVGSEDALRIVKTICDALQYAHSRGVIHRDIKPENVLLGEDGTLKVADFGIAKIIDNSSRGLTATRQVLGSLHYLAPEHLESPQEVDHRVDLYAVGVVLYELLTGQLPIGRFEPPSLVARDAAAGSTSRRIDEIVMKTLSRRPEKRFQSAGELSAALERAESLDAPPIIEPADEPAASAPEPEVAGYAVPFTCETMGGFAEIAGMISSSREGLLLEYRVRDVFWGGLKSKTHQVRIPRGQLARVDLVGRIFSSKLILVARNISALQDLPNAETGRVQLKIKQSDYSEARALVDGLAVGNGSSPSLFTPPYHSSAVAAKASPHWMTFSVLMILCGLINAALLAVAEFLAAQEIMNSSERIPLMISAAVLFGPVGAFQLLSGFLSLFSRPIHLARAAAIVSLLPIAPAFPLSLPLGIWTLMWLREGSTSGQPKGRSPAHAAHDLAGRQPPSSQRSWTATTLMYIRETRQGKLLAGLNFLGLVAVVAALGVYLMGLYPSQITYRIVKSDVQAEELLQAIEARLGPGVGMSVNGNRLTIRDVQANLDDVRAMLELEGQPGWVWLTPLDATQAETRQAESVDISGDLGLPLAYRQETGLGSVANSLSSEIAIEPDDFSEVEAKPGSLRFFLTEKGRERILSARPQQVGRDASAEAESQLMLGLLADGLLIGFSQPQTQSAREIEFEVSRVGDWTASLVAAARGPALPSELELLE